MRQPDVTRRGLLGTTAAGLAVGYNLNDTIAFVPAFLRGYLHNNQMLDIALPGAAYFRLAKLPCPTTASSCCCG